MSLHNGIDATPAVERFSYDSLHRMTAASRSGGASGSVSYGYDAVGNFTHKSDFSKLPASGTPAPYQYGVVGKTAGGNAGPNAVRQVTRSNGAIQQFSYDASGNLIADSGTTALSVQYDHRQLAVKTCRGGACSYLMHGADDARARQWGSDGSRIYLDAYEDVITGSAGGTVETRAYLGDYAVVSRQSDGSEDIDYLLKDRLGSVDAVADGGGMLRETRGYDAFGKPRQGSWADRAPPRLGNLAATQKGFTQHEHLNSVELIHMNGRVFDFNLGRFLSVDPFIQFPLNGQSLNPYSYILNNPLSGTDPTGYCAAPTGSHIKRCGAPVTVTAVKNDNTRQNLGTFRPGSARDMTRAANTPIPGGGGNGARGGQGAVVTSVADSSQGGAPGMMADAGRKSGPEAPITITASGATASSASQIGEAAGAPDLVLSSAQQAKLVEAMKMVGSARMKRERYIVFDKNMKVIRGPTSAGCTNSECVATAAAGDIILHRHVNSTAATSTKRESHTLTREFPGPGDHNALDFDVINAYVSPKGALRVIERVSSVPSLRTIAGGDSAWDTLVETNWRPGMNTKEFESIIEREQLQ